MKNRNQTSTISMVSTSNFKGIALSLVFIAIVSGCNLSDDKEKEVTPVTKNVAPTTITVDLITQTETAITDMLSATDIDGDNLSFSLEQQATLGMVNVESSGAFTYQPNNEVTGNDSFTFNVTDGVNPAVRGTVNITIEALEVSFASQSRAAFNQLSTDKPVAINGRTFIQDVDDPMAFDDLISQ